MLLCWREKFIFVADRAVKFWQDETLLYKIVSGPFYVDCQACDDQEDVNDY